MNNIYYILYIYLKLKYFFLNIDLLLYYIAWNLTNNHHADVLLEE